MLHNFSTVRAGHILNYTLLFKWCHRNWHAFSGLAVKLLVNAIHGSTFAVCPLSAHPKALCPGIPNSRECKVWSLSHRNVLKSAWCCTAEQDEKWELSECACILWIRCRFASTSIAVLLISLWCLWFLYHHMCSSPRAPTWAFLGSSADFPCHSPVRFHGTPSGRV